MSSRTPLVSVLVTARDNERHVAASLRSVLSQTLGDLELLVVDDGSRDSTPEILRSFDDERMDVAFAEESEGVPARRNELVERARGRYIAILDADDLWLPDHLQQLVGVLETQLDVVATGSGVLTVDDGLRVGRYFRMPATDGAVRWLGLFTSPFIHSASVIRATVFANGVRYDPRYPLAQDYDLWTKVLPRGRGLNLHLPSALYRVHHGQATQQRATAQRKEHEEIGRGAIEQVDASIDATLAWKIGVDAPLPDGELEVAVAVYRRLFDAYVRRHEGSADLGEARRIAATTLLRRAAHTRSRATASLIRGALAIDPRVPVSSAVIRFRNRRTARRVRPAVERTIAAL